ncbi:MAG: GNAT family N-acetyltransferase [Pseudomonadales bacterium]|nr:GNAT family N-acetyltransferase [Pseudomonadales bacterium]
MLIRKIKSIDTLSLRQEILRPRSEVSECLYEGDDDNTTAHFGAVQNDTIVGIISVYNRSNPIICSDHGFQLRAMATASNVRGRGIGLKLLEAAENYAEQNNSNYIWANSRTVAIGFYKKAGYTIESQEFEIKGVGPHYLVRKRLA